MYEFMNESSHDIIWSTEDFVLSGPRQLSDQDFDLIHLSAMKKNNNIIISIRRISSKKRSSKQWTY